MGFDTQLFELLHYVGYVFDCTCIVEEPED